MFKQLESIDLDKLRALYFVGKYGSVVVAANYLGVTPAAISIRLKKLEATLRVRLFERRPNKLVFTERGHVLFKEANHVFEALARMQEVLTDVPDRYAGKLVVSVQSDLAGFFAPQIAAFSQKHPALRIRILSRSSAESVALVREDEIDLGISVLSKMPRILEKTKLLDSKLCLVFPKTHALAKKKQISLADIAGCRLIMHGPRSSSRPLINSVFGSSGIEIENILEASTCDLIVEFVRLGLGVGLVHDLCLSRRRDKKLRFSEMGGQFGGLEVSLVYKRSASFKAARQALIESLVKSCQ
jgi:LysR family cyn operon transcriptional activator